MANADTQDTSSRPLGTNATLQTASPVQDTSAVLTPPEKDEKAGKTASFRGPLHYETETSSPLVEAGRTFSIYLRITNPYEVPVQQGAMPGVAACTTRRRRMPHALDGRALAAAVGE